MRDILWLILICLLLGQSLRAETTETSEERDFSAPFGNYSGAFVLFDAPHQKWLRFHPRECGERSTPCSTFKILNSLIALETGVATGADFSLRWDGTKHPIEAWNRDQTLRSAFSVSCLWYYETLAARIGMAKYKPVMERVGYGNGDLSGGLPHFWLESSLTISPDEQVRFLRRLHARELPFSAKSVDTLLDIMTLSKSGKTVFRGKTGSAGDAVKGIATLGWFVGSVTTAEGDYFFATRIKGGDNPSGRTARGITEAILLKLGLLPAQK
jgi:bla regulator protein BlaR1